MESKFLALYKVVWHHTAATYVAASSYRNAEEIKTAVRNDDDRCDDIVSVERVFLPAFDGDCLRNAEFVHIFLRDPIAL